MEKRPSFSLKRDRSRFHVKRVRYNQELDIWEAHFPWRGWRRASLMYGVKGELLVVNHGKYIRPLSRNQELERYKAYRIRRSIDFIHRRIGTDGTKYISTMPWYDGCARGD